MLYLVSLCPSRYVDSSVDQIYKLPYMLDSSSVSGIYQLDSRHNTRESPHRMVGPFSPLSNRDLKGSNDPEYMDDSILVLLFLCTNLSFVLTVGAQCFISVTFGMHIHGSVWRYNKAKC